MKILRKLLAMLLVAMALTLSVATTAQADGGDAAKDWTSYVCYQLEVC
jgi:type IV secretory pathway VirB2 component (pilin)